MSIGKTIKLLLEEQKRVILPGFGNLEIKSSGGGFPTTGKRIDPPGLNIQFDSTYSKDDGLISSTLTEKEEMVREEAEQQVLELVDAIRFALDKGESYLLDEAGTFSRDDDGKVHFQPEAGWVLEPDQYGLESMELLELEDLSEEEAPTQPLEQAKTDATKEEERKAVATGPVDKPVRREPVTAQAPAKPQVHEPWKREKTHKRGFRGWRMIWMIAGFLIVILVVLILIPSDTLDSVLKRDQTEQQPTGMEDENATEDQKPAVGEETVPAETDEPVPADAGQETTQEDSPPAEETTAPHNFYIIAGSFKHLGNASELQDKLKARGFSSEVMVTENRMYRVSVASYASKAEAERGLSGIKSEPGMEACWLLSNE